MKRIAFVAVAVLAATAAWMSGRQRPGIMPGETGAAPAATPAEASLGESNRRATGPAKPVAQSHEVAIAALRQRLEASSLRGATPDGDITIGREGRLRVDAALRRRFDWYLSLEGEFGLEEIRALLLADVRDAQGAAMSAVVAEWFDRYLGLRAELAQTAFASDPALRLAQLQSAQQRWFGASAEALFGDELAALAATIERRAIANDASLTEAERTQRLARLEATRPAIARAAQAEASAALLLAEQEAQFQQLGLDAAQRHAERSALWGEAAAVRLAALDREQADWEARLREYRGQRDLLAGQSGREPRARARELQALRERLFSPTERLRVESLEAIGALHPGG
jgi:lipase chaperone LimK